MPVIDVEASFPRWPIANPASALLRLEYGLILIHGDAIGGQEGSILGPLPRGNIVRCLGLAGDALGLYGLDRELPITPSAMSAGPLADAMPFALCPPKDGLAPPAGCLPGSQFAFLRSHRVSTSVAHRRPSPPAGARRGSPGGSWPGAERPRPGSDPRGSPGS